MPACCSAAARLFAAPGAALIGAVKLGGLKLLQALTLSTVSIPWYKVSRKLNRTDENRENRMKTGVKTIAKRVKTVKTIV